MKRGITVWEECETCEGGGVLPEDHGLGMIEYLSCPDCGGTGSGRSVSLPLEKVDHVQGMTHLIDGSPPKVSVWINDGLLED